MTNPNKGTGASRATLSVRQCVAGILLHALTQAASAANPPLPTPCIGNSCVVGGKSLSFVSAGQAGASVAGNAMNVTQTSNAAILNWQNFNIANGYSVTFKQPNSTAATLNRIYSADPSVIAGKLSANGQVYLINQNGIIFSGGAQVNVGSLTASTLDLADSTFLNGLLSGNTSTATSGGQLPPVFQVGSTGKAGSVTVNQGAEIQTADGGRVMLLGTTVNNAGTISTPDGQAILAAGTTAYLASTTDPNLRGLLIAVDGQELAANSTVTNTGKITAERGNITLAGLVVNQAGTVSATTSVNANGSIYLIAGDADAAVGSFYNPASAGISKGQVLPNVGGTLTLAPGSVTEVTPDKTDTTTITNSQTFYTSQVNLAGKTITLQGNATISAPGGQVGAVASENPYRLQQGVDGKAPPAGTDDGRIYLDSASTIDVSGLQQVAAPAAENLVQIQLGANELQDDPLLRTGFLHGQTVTVDVTKGTPLLNQATLLSYANTIAHTVSEKLTTGGTINLVSGGDVITRAGSVQNVSGGSTAFQASAGSTTKLIGADGKVYDISSAPNNIQYVGFADSYSYIDPRWGTKSSWGATGNLPGFLQGAAAGAIGIEGPQIYLRGTTLGQTTPGPYQRSAATLPSGGSLTLGNSNPSADLLGNKNFDLPSITVVGAVEDTLGAFDPTSSRLPLQPSSVVAAGDLAGNGFNHIGVYSSGSVTVPTSTALTLPGNGSLTLEGTSVTVTGSIRAPGSNVTLKTDLPLTGESTTTSLDSIVLGEGAKIDVSGAWVNDSPLVTTQLGTAPTLYSGGNVSITAANQSDVVLETGSVIDVSGSGWVNSSNKLTAGAAGSITLKAGGPLAVDTYATGGVTLGGSLRGASLTSGGSLSITSSWVTVAGDPTGKQGELLLTPDFFTQGGFRNYSITGINGLTIGSKDPDVPVTIHPIQQSLVFNSSMLLQPTGANLADFTTLETLPDEYRSPASLSFASTLSSFSAPGAGNITFNSSVSIDTDPGATVALTVRENLSVFGKITAPAGTINLQLAPGVGSATSGDSDGYIATQELLIGSTARLSAPGYAAIYTDNPLAYRRGQVLSGGTIELTANKGSVVAESGSILDVSGTSGVIDVVQQGRGVTPTTVAGAAGAIDIEARESIVLNATLVGRAANAPGAAGGSLTIGLDPFNLQLSNSYDVPGSSTGNPYPTSDRNLILTSKSGLSDTLPVDKSGNFEDGVAEISTSAFANGGFDNIRLSSPDMITLDGATTLASKSSLVLNAQEFAATAGAKASLGSAYVALTYNSVLYPLNTTARNYSPVTGDGTLNVAASLIDISGNTALSGFQAAAFNSSSDVRLGYAIDSNDATDFTGSLKSSAALTFKAAQVYPTTGTHFTINPTDVGSSPDPTQEASYSYIPGSVTIFPGAASSVPLSALAELTINAPEIDQYGVLRAPFGQITLNGIGPQSIVTLHAGSVTSVSASGTVIPYGSTQNGQQWTYQVDDAGASSITSLLSSLSPKQVNLGGSDVVIDSNAKVDLSGGGDLYAYEFIAGTGGSKDVLSPGTGAYSYAILPGLGSQFAPIDHQYSIGTNIPTGQELYVSGVPGLANGYYALLPARYALLPGAYAVQLVKQNSDITSGPATLQPGGAYLAAGRFAVAGTDVIDSRNSTFLVAPSSVVRTQSEYTDSYANTFFTAQAAATKTTAVNLPADAGELELSASQNLRLQGSIGFAPAQFVVGKDSKGNDIVQTGVGGIASIVASTIEVVEPGATPDGALQLTPDSLNHLGASTLILGATRTAGAKGDTLNVGATSVTVENTAADPLSAPEILLAARQTIELASGSSIKAAGTSGDSVSILNVQGDGALLRASTGSQATIVRSSLPDSPQGLLDIGSSASVNATSLALDAAGDTRVAADATINAQAVEASSSRISLGDVPADATGLSVTSQLLSTLSGLTDLSLHSDSTIDFYGAVTLGELNASTGAPVLKSVTLDAQGIGGYGAGDKTIQASSITLSNVGASQSSAPFTAPPDGTGKLVLSATSTDATKPAQIALGAGDKAVQGFGAVVLSAAGGDIRAQKSGSLNLTNAGSLTLQSARISTDSGVQQSITNNTGAVGIAMLNGGSAPLEASGLGGHLTITGTATQGNAAITQNGFIDLPSGTVILQAKGSGDVSLGAGSTINTAGAAQPYFDTYAASAGGTVQLAADQGGVNILTGATVDVSGTTAPDGKTSSDAGTLSILAPHGQFNLAGVIRGSAAAGQKGGDFTLDTAGGVGRISALNLGGSGFTGALSIRDRGDATVIVDGTTTARSFELAADQGAISVTGAIDTSSSNGNGGNINLWALGDLTVANGASLITAGRHPAGTTTTTRGGDITLGSTNGWITLAAGSTIDPRGAVGSDNPGVNPDGRLVLEAHYNAGSGTININPIGAKIQGSQPATQVTDPVTGETKTKPATTVIIDGAWSYDNVTSIGDSGDLSASTLSTDIQAFASNAGAIATALTPTDNSFGVQVRPAIEIRSQGDLTLSQTLDLHSLATSADNGVPIDLTLRAAGNLVFNGSLSDGFTSARGTIASWTLAGSDSATYHLTAGADLSSADPLSTQRGVGNFILTPGNLIRTGNGNIDIAAGKDICLGCTANDLVSTLPTAQQSVVYTAGVASQNAPSFFTAPTIANSAGVPAEFPVGGGDISLTASGNIVSAPTTNLVSNWLWRQGSAKPDGTVTRDTAWWIESNAFQQGVGALGGGNVTVEAGGDIVNLSVVIPTNGRVGTTGAATGNTSLLSSLVVNGGGDLAVTAGGNVESGVFQDDLGHASIRAGGAIEAAAGRGVAPILVAANSTFDLHAGGDVTLDGMYNSTALPEAVANRSGVSNAGLGLNTFAYFYTYAPTSALDVVSAGGAVTLNDASSAVLIATGGSFLDGNAKLFNLYPGTVNVAALSGDINVKIDTLELFPSASGNLNLLAQGDINFQAAVRMSEIDPSQVNGLLNPIITLPDLNSDPLPIVPLHQGDSAPARIVAADGSIQYTTATATILPKQADFVAGKDIVNLNYLGKNLNPSDVTLFQASGAIQYDTKRDTTNNQLTTNSAGIQVGGPGYVEVLAGGEIDLGDSTGIVTSGRLNDARLPSTGATLVTAAGLGTNADGSKRDPAYGAFINSYLAPGSSGTPSPYAADLLQYMLQLYPDETGLSQSQALTQFSALPNTLRLPFIAQILTDELSATGIDHNKLGTPYDRGYKAINTLFPTKDANGNALTYKGDINMFFSQLKTEQGGDIDLLAPGGSVVVGVPNPPQELSTVKADNVNGVSADANLGALVLAQGAIQGFANGDFDVNQSRMLTLQGGNIILWSSYGNIDAGKGAKTAQGAPPPVIQTDSKGNVFVNPIGAVSGSGIGQLLTVQGIKAGLVNLIAPTGVVNAGEAGIRAAGDLNIAAVAVLNVGNIKVGGTATGLPVSDVGALNGALSGANALGDAGKAVADQLSNSLSSGSNFQQLTESLQPSFIVVRMFCLGVQCDTQ